MSMQEFLGLYFLVTICIFITIAIRRVYIKASEYYGKRLEEGITDLIANAIYRILRGL